MLLFAFIGSSPILAQTGERYALLIGGLGGSPEHTDRFKSYLYDTRKALVESFGFSEANVAVLGETKIQEESFVNAVSTAENIRSHFQGLQGTLTSDDELYVVLFGHGGYENGEARLNIPRRDLSQNDYAQLVDQLDVNRLVFINTASASAPFIEALGGVEGRIIITATRTGTQKNETSFPRFMVEAFANPGTDRDKDSRISVAEVYLFAAERTAQWFDDNGNIPTEDALIADTGEAQGYRLAEIDEAGAGQLAAFTYLSPGQASLLAASGQGTPAQTDWLRERNQIELDIAALKSQKAGMNVDDYYAQLEVLLVRLARGNEQLEMP